MVNHLKLITLIFMASIFSLSSIYAEIGTTVIKGGTFKYKMDNTPTTLNPLSSTDLYATRVQEFVMESLLKRNWDDYKYQPRLAKSWKISDDGLEFTFVLRDGLKWHDGTELTVEDVKFSFDAVVDKKNTYKTASKKPFYENIKEVIIVDKKTVKFRAKRVSFSNFSNVADLTIVPKHLHKNASKIQLKKLNKTLVGSGPYQIKKFKRGKSLILVKNKNWWGNKDPLYKDFANFDKILIRFIKDGTIAIQRMGKGDLDFLMLTPEEYVKKTDSKNWKKKVIKHKIANLQPSGYGFIGWNMKNPLFTSVKTRKALGMLLNRDFMIKKFLFGLREKGNGPLYGVSPYADQSVKPLEFLPKDALILLKEDGWSDSDGDQILDKMIGGKKTSLSFTILEPNQEFMKYLTIYKEDAKQAGVDIKLKVVEWNTFIKLLDERKFEAVRLGWGGGDVNWDPKQIWHSESIKNSGSNFVSYSNKKVDELIDLARITMDDSKRKVMLKKVYRMIAEDHPYAFFFSKKYRFYGVAKGVGQKEFTKKFKLGKRFWWRTK